LSEGSEPTNPGTEEHEPHTEAIRPDKQAHHCNVQNADFFSVDVEVVDTAVIGRKKMFLPGEVSRATG